MPRPQTAYPAPSDIIIDFAKREIRVEGGTLAPVPLEGDSINFQSLDAIIRRVRAAAELYRPKTAKVGA